MCTGHHKPFMLAGICKQKSPGPRFRFLIEASTLRKILIKFTHKFLTKSWQQVEITEEQRQKQRLCKKGKTSALDYCNSLHFGVVIKAVENVHADVKIERILCRTV